MIKSLVSTHAAMFISYYSYSFPVSCYKEHFTSHIIRRSQPDYLPSLACFSFLRDLIILPLNGMCFLCRLIILRIFCSLEKDLIEATSINESFTLLKLCEIGPSFSDKDSSCTTFSSPLFIACISSARYFS